MSQQDIPRASELLDHALRALAAPPPPEMTGSALRAIIWKYVFQARDLLRQEPIGIWPSDPDGDMAATARNRARQIDSGS